MSEVGKELVPTLIEQTGDVPETVIPAEPAPEPVDPEPAPEATETPVEASPQAPKRTPWYQVRLNQMAEQRDKERAEKEELRAKLAELAPAEGETPQFKPEQLQGMIRQEAAKIVQAEKAQERNKGFLNAGVKEFGAEEFTEKCNMVASMGAGDSAEFMQIITDPDIFPDGHKVVAALADNPDEAQRILSLDPIKMAGALAKFAFTATPKAPAPISSAPAPIRTVGGSAKATAPEDTDDIKAWIAKRNATARTTAGGKPNSH